MTKILLLCVAGSAGTLARYGLQGLVQRLADSTFPWGTMAVNLIGCLIFGLIWALADERLLIQPQTRTILLVGFLGAFTTFSSFVFETGELIRDSQWAYAIGNLLAQNVLGLLLFFVGLRIGRLI